MAAITENSIAQITLPVGTTAQFDAHKVAGFTGWNTDLGALVTCPGDGADFVALGTSSVLDAVRGKVWNARATAAAAFSDYRYTLIEHNGTSFLQVDGHSSGKTLARRSLDGYTWTEFNLPTGASWKGLKWCAASSLWVLVGYGDGGVPKILTSADTVTWTARSVATVSYLYGLAVDGAQLIACSNGSAYYARSIDGGLTWTAVASPGASSYDRIHFKNGTWLMLGGSVCTKSVDGATWDTPVASPATGWGLGRHVNNNLEYFGGVYWLTGNSTLFGSSDGKTWVYMSNLRSVSAPWYPSEFECIAAHNGTLMMVAQKGAEAEVRLLMSRDGYLFEEVGFPQLVEAYGTFSIGNVFQALGKWWLFGYTGNSFNGVPNFTAESLA